MSTTTLPAWTTAESFIEDGTLYCKHHSATGAQIMQAFNIQRDAGNIRYVAGEEPTIWLKDAAEGMTLEQARTALQALHELIPLLEQETRR